MTIKTQFSKYIENAETMLQDGFTSEEATKIVRLKSLRFRSIAQDKGISSLASFCNDCFKYATFTAKPSDVVAGNKKDKLREELLKQVTSVRATLRSTKF